LDSGDITQTVSPPNSGRLWASRPLRAFVLSSLLFGCLMIGAAPPLRGPDERAHFLRAYGVAAEHPNGGKECGMGGIWSSLPAVFFLGRAGASGGGADVCPLCGF
jgi:hypothetical protein